jgi:hypothetical protein
MRTEETNDPESPKDFVRLIARKKRPRMIERKEGMLGRIQFVLYLFSS